MKLFTDEQYEKLISNGTNPAQISYPPVVKLFISWTDCCWLLTELDPDHPDIAFGLCDLGVGCPEVGYVSISELKAAQRGLKVLERDTAFESEFPLIAYTRAAWEMGCIVTDRNIVMKHHRQPPPK